MQYKIHYNIGKIKYVLSYSDGTKKHKDGSGFCDIKCFNNKKELKKYIKEKFKKCMQS